ncbi:MAG TPA: hypothetical protein VKB80_19005 [Kofleriaceae bacterium]|nr:hypothetical protein [Kofleriaceae bacterium]
MIVHDAPSPASLAKVACQPALGSRIVAVRAPRRRCSRGPSGRWPRGDGEAEGCAAWSVAACERFAACRRAGDDQAPSIASVARAADLQVGRRAARDVTGRALDIASGRMASGRIAITISTAAATIALTIALTITVTVAITIGTAATIVITTVTSGRHHDRRPARAHHRRRGL